MQIILLTYNLHVHVRVSKDACDYSIFFPHIMSSCPPLPERAPLPCFGVAVKTLSLSGGMPDFR